MRKVVVAAVQWSPEFHNVDSAISKARDAMRQAAKQGVNLLVFPESWLQGYPYWASISVRDSRFHEFRRALRGNAIRRQGPEMTALCVAAKESHITVCIGFHELCGETIYNSVAYISADGELQRVHRKLVPTTTERLVWGRGDGSDLDPVETECGRLGGLICFEHQMAPARHALCLSGVEIHASLWPGHDTMDDVIDASTRHLAYENGCFVVVAREIMSSDRVPANLPDISDEPERWNTHGGSAIIAPNGKYLAGPLFNEETILAAEIELGQITDTKWWFDGAGHYSRPDVFQLLWDKSEKTNMSEPQ